MLPEVVGGQLDLDWLTPREVWARYAISEATQKRWREKNLHGWRDICYLLGNQVRYKRAEVERLVEAHGLGPPLPPKTGPSPAELAAVAMPVLAERPVQKTKRATKEKSGVRADEIIAGVEALPCAEFELLPKKDTDGRQ
jgi:hypothetical protein